MIELAKRKETVYYYKGWFGKIYKVEIMASEEKIYTDVHGMTCSHYEHVIKFENGKLKHVHENTMMKGEEEVYDI